MRIAVLDIAASESGALTILNEFYESCKYNSDKDDEFVFILGTFTLEDTENINVYNYPNAKKSWIHRICFDLFKLKKLIEKLHIDAVISLQNLVITRCKIPQYLYMHNALPFVNYKYKINQNLRLWIYQNVLKIPMIKSIEKAKYTFVQTEWLKNKLLDYAANATVIVTKPNVSLNPVKIAKKYTDGKFIYPTTAFDYKNITAIIESLKLINKSVLNHIEVLLTLNGDENNLAKRALAESQKYNLPIKFIGRISKKQLFNYFANYSLIFPSYIESVGLPLLEARYSNTFIIASDTENSREVLEGYKNRLFFSPFNYTELAEKIKLCVSGVKIQIPDLTDIRQKDDIFKDIYFKVKMDHDGLTNN